MRVLYMVVWNIKPRVFFSKGKCCTPDFDRFNIARRAAVKRGVGLFRVQGLRSKRVTPLLLNILNFQCIQSVTNGVGSKLKHRLSPRLSLEFNLFSPNGEALLYKVLRCIVIFQNAHFSYRC